MRLIADFDHEKEAFSLRSYLISKGISTLYDFSKQSGSNVSHYTVWVIEEDDIEKAIQYFEEWKQNPTDYTAHSFESIHTPVKPSKNVKAAYHTAWKVSLPKTSIRPTITITTILILICSAIFFWNGMEIRTLTQKYGTIAEDNFLTPVQKKLLFDEPVYRNNIQEFIEEHDIRTEQEFNEMSPELQKEFDKIQRIPAWKGFLSMILARDWSVIDQLPKGTLFHKIRQGEFWRAVTPILMHGNLLHILFNMLWLFTLGNQIEERIGRGKYLLLTLLLAIGSNTAQYLVSGPEFLGYSGVLMGFVGFIWMRQKKAPWEGYPLQKSVIGFIVLFVLAMFFLDFITLSHQFVTHGDKGISIANTAHIIGGLLGVLLGKLSLFSRGRV